MKDFLAITIYLTPALLAIVTFTHWFEKSSKRKKIVIVSILAVVPGVFSFWKDSITEAESLAEKQILEKTEQRRDSIVDAKNEKDKLNIINTFTEGFARYELKINTLVPLLSDIKIQSFSDGIILTYQLNKPVEKLKVVFGPSPYDESFDKSYGAGFLELPRKLGSNSIKIDFKKLGLGEMVTLDIKTENPFYSFPTIEHNHSLNSVTDVKGFLLTEDGRPILNDNGRKILVEKGN